MLLLAWTTLAAADEARPGAQVVFVSPACASFRHVPGGLQSPAAWDAILSFAACIQDASVYRVERAEVLAGFVEQLHVALVPAVQLYANLVNEAPDSVKVRAVHAIALAQVSLMTRARLSLATPKLAATLEDLLEEPARFAYLLFTTIDRAAAANPDLFTDPVNRHILHSSRTFAAALRTRWPKDDEPAVLLGATPTGERP